MNLPHTASHNVSLLATSFSDATLAEIFSDARYVAHLLRVEAALALVEARRGVIPAGAGPTIAAAAKTVEVDYAALRAAMDQDGFPIIELARQLRQAVIRREPAAAAYVHWGATTQDIMDTALVLQLREALAHLEWLLHRVIAALAALAERHRHTLMAGRTHAQQAVPIPFGYKVAGWLAPLLRQRDRLAEFRPRLLVVQLGGAAGTLGALGADGAAIQADLAAELGLGVPLMTWHTQRDSLVELAGWLSLLTGVLAKMGQDVILLSQSEVGEVSESGDESRGGSSTMPQKHNPILSEILIAAARANAAQLSALHQAMPHEHERGTHGWQVEWLTLPPMLIQSAAALGKAAYLAENMTVHADRMRHNVEASRGLMLAEALNLALAPSIGRAEARQVIQAACEIALREDRHVVDIVRERIGERGAALNWAALRDESRYFGAADTFIDRVLNEARQRKMAELKDT